MSQPRTAELQELDKIIARHLETFVLLDNCRFDGRGRPTHCRVVHSTADRDEIYQAMRDYPTSVLIFTGTESEELEGAFLDTCGSWRESGLVEGV